MSNLTLFQYNMSLKGQACWKLNIRVHEAEKLSLEAMGLLVEASGEIRFDSRNREQVYSWLERVLVGQE